ncbi:YbaB/EbfC family nucleoid-associated protein [Mycobacterium sp. Aquia_213]|uniref:YbaB/EbfC family nucleoid-associated protein n=1 Tax=Mycobacterium sp. Aquia_213 TaxID=2991728 RepID=UPI00226DC067|nr:YbaB/EbfC family nucleoid-associated protein [Mycobacterium sp. Aquia_213]WAC91687.1 YbaB/EbfC family nucleoid-associated protein [Mycobacterium sp. Aquia_213]
MQPQEHPQATAVMDEFKKFGDVLEGALKQRGTGSFTAKDETETVEVVINGDMCVTQVNIEDGLLRLGAETVQERINEALMRATAEAAASIEASQLETFEKLTQIVDSLQKITGED